MNSRLGAESLFVVRRSVRRFMREYDIQSYPLNCFRLLYAIREKQLIHLDILEIGKLSAAFDAVAEYFPSVDSYAIVMKPVPERWKERSPDRRCNFTLAWPMSWGIFSAATWPFPMRRNPRRSASGMTWRRMSSPAAC